jgi:hypothetical protein
MSSQLAKDVESRSEQVRRQRLHFVKDDDGSRDAVELATTRRTRGKKRFNELDGGRDNDRGVPVFRDKFEARFFFFIRILGRRDAGVIFEHNILAKDATIFRGVLLDDREVGYYYNDAAHAVRAGMGERKSHGSESLSATRGYSD